MRGVPDFGAVLHRPRIVGQLERAGGRLKVLAGPSGCGKTMAVADYAVRSGYLVVWIDASGEALGACAVLRRVLGALAPSLECGGEAARPQAPTESDLIDASLAAVVQADLERGLLVVVDDVACDTSGSLDSLASVHAALAHAGVHLAVTTRDERVLRDEALRSALILDHHAMSASWEECVGLAGLLGCDQNEGLQEVHQTAASNMALLTLILQESAHGGTSWGPNLSTLAGACLQRLLDSRLSVLEQHGLILMALLQHGCVGDLQSMGVPSARRLLDQLVDVPLFLISARGSDHGSDFSVHDLAVDWLLKDLDSDGVAIPKLVMTRVSAILGNRGDYRRACTLLRRFGESHECAEWVGSFGDDAIAAGHGAEVAATADHAGIHEMMRSAGLLRVWSEALLADARPEDAVGKAKAAIELAQLGEHEDDAFRCQITLIEAFKRLDCHQECAAVAARLMPHLRSGGSLARRVEACVAVARVNCNIGRLSQAHDAIQIAAELCEASSIDACDHSRVLEYQALIRALKFGDHWRSAQVFAAAIPSLDQWLSERISVRGNLAVSLLEAGRVSRAAPLVKYAVSAGDGYYRSAFAVLAALLEAATGATPLFRTLMEESIQECLKAGCEYDLAANRTCLAVALRALGEPEAALEAAERAFERLSVMDYMGYRRYAVLEMSASLLALGDVAASRRWAETVCIEGFDSNQHLALRASMILAACDYRDGQGTGGDQRLADHASHIRSESSNWQMAMYCRAFPELLGMLAAAVGADELPIHMLRMILPEHAESCLSACEHWLDREEWVCLGRRAIGPNEFARFQEHKGDPLCHVRLFGGLGVAVGDRILTDRDWKKGKARLLFAMLVVRRGQDVPREQVLEYLWPDLPAERARNNFYVVWSAMKSALMGGAQRSESCPFIEHKGGRLRIVLGSLRSDVDEFEETLLAARTADSEGDCSEALSAYSRLIGVYRGELLPGDIYDDWFTPIRDRFSFEFIDAMLRAVELHLERQDPCEALLHARSAMSVDPLREDVYQATLRCQIAAGQRSGAIETFLQCKRRLSEDLGLDPSADTMALYQEILVMEGRPRYGDYGLG